MSIRSFFYVIIITLVFGVTGCKTYYIQVDSFRKQFAGFDTAGSKLVTTKSPWRIKQTYKTSPIDSILCVDKNGNNFVLKNSPSLEIRFTDNENKRTVFYFDRITVHNDTVTGVQSRIISAIKSSVPLNKVKTIEIQDGGKKYSYVK